MFRAALIFLMQALAFSAAAEMAAGQGQASKVDERATFLDGEWIGAGTFFLGKEWGNQITSCSEVTLKFVGDKEKYEVHQGFAVCNGKRNAFNDDSKFGIKEDGTVFYVSSKDHTLTPGAIVGSVSDRTLHTATIHENAIDDVTIIRKGNILIYRQWNAPSEGNAAYAFTAILTQDLSLIKK